MFRSPCRAWGAALLWGVALGSATLPPACRAQDAEDLQNLLENVGQEYAHAYLAPLIQSFGANQNSGLYSTAAIPASRLTVSIGVRAMAARLAEEDAFFSREVDVTLDEDWGVAPTDPYYGDEGTVVMTGPTVFGDEHVRGVVQAYHDGVLVAEMEGIEGVWQTRTAPLAVPEVSVGGVLGLRATARWLPAIDAGDIGAVRLWGYGLQYGLNQLLPMLPLDAMVGFFRQSLDIGDDLNADADSWFLAASKSFTMVTVYGGYARESSDLDVTYEWIRSPDDVVPIDFNVEGLQTSRFTLGATLNLGVRLNADVNVGNELTTWSAGLTFGI